LGVTAVVVAATLTVAGGALAADQAVMATADDEFVPADVTVTQGEKVTWTNAGGTHNVSFDDGSFVQPTAPIESRWTVERVFNTPGTFGYICVAHAPSMAGTVTVLAAGPPAGAPPVNPTPGGPAPSLALLKVTLKVSDSTPSAGARVRLFGAVRPARDGRKVQLQKRVRTGEFRTVATTRLRDAGTAKSAFSLRLRVSGNASFRARVTGDDERATGVSRTRKLDVQPPQ
jgi:plastocyanin